MIVRLDGVVHLPGPDVDSAAWRIAAPCRLSIDFDVHQVLGTANLTRAEDGAIRASAEIRHAGIDLLVRLATRLVLALGVISPEDPERAEVVSVAVVGANEDPRVPEYLMIVDAEGADELELSMLRDLAAARRRARTPSPLELELAPGLGTVNLGAARPLPRRHEPPGVRCTRHPAEWAEGSGCRRCHTEYREQTSRNRWLANVAAHLESHLREAAAGRAHPWDPHRPALLARRALRIPGWCGIGLEDRAGTLVFLCARTETHTGPCTNRDAGATFDGTVYYAEKGTHRA